MKVLCKQRNSKMCMICGMDNIFGLQAPFYTMEDESVMSVFRFKDLHQSYPERVHGGMIAAMLDEMGLRAMWAHEGSEQTFGVTLSLETKYRKPVPYDCELLGKGIVVKNTGNFFTTECSIVSGSGELLANAVVKYMKLDPHKISQNATVHEEMCYLIPDERKDISLG